MPAYPLTRAQVKTVLKTTPLLRDQALLTLGFQTGFRISELLPLTIGELTDVYGQVKSIITVTKSHMKGKQFSRTVRLNSDTQRALSKLVKKLKQHNRAPSY